MVGGIDGSLKPQFRKIVENGITGKNM